jgi:hypothetical protein
MKFCNYLLRVDGVREASLDDFKRIIQIRPSTSYYSHKKYLYEIEIKLIEERFFWMTCNYDNTKEFRDYVFNQNTESKEPNPRSKDQIELRQQFFVCYDCQKNFLYLNDMGRRSFLQQYLSDILQKEFIIKNIYTSVGDFCDRIKTIRGFRYTQIDDLFGRNSDLFKQVGSIWGHDLPSKVQLKVSYGDLPIHEGGRGIVDILTNHREEFEDIIIIGCDDKGMEQTFDFSSVLKHLSILPTKDENEHFNPMEVQKLLLNELR